MIRTNTKYNKSIISIATAALLTIALTGCGDKTPVPNIEEVDERCHIDSVLAPQWACGGSMINGTITSVGSAPYSKLGQGFSRREAVANGRSNLAQQIQSDVKDKVETFARSTGIGSTEVADRVSTQVSKQVAKVTLNGSRQMKFWQSPTTNELYILVGVDENSTNKEIKEQIVSSYKNDNALWQQFQAKNALESLDKEFPTD